MAKWITPVVNFALQNSQHWQQYMLEEITTNHLALLVFTDPEVVPKIKLNKSALRYWT
jgi:hypothetical protein